MTTSDHPGHYQTGCRTSRYETAALPLSLCHDLIVIALWCHQIGNMVLVREHHLDALDVPEGLYLLQDFLFEDGGELVA